jgi:sodium-coupled neutral amino acid transporter 10
VGICAYTTFRQRTAGDVLRNFGGADAQGMRGAYERAIKACFALAVLGSIPLAILPFYTIVQPLLQRATPPRRGGGGGGARDKARQSGPDRGFTDGGAAGLQLRSKDCGVSFSTVLVGPEADPVGTVIGGAVGSGGSTVERRRTAATQGDHADGNGFAASGAVPAPPGALPGLLRAGSGAAAAMVDPHLDPHLAAHDAEVALSFPQHALLTFLLLGLGMAAALWLPNLEFIFGLTGATTSVVISFIMPALCFLRLAGPDPEVTFGAFGGTPSKTGGAPGAACGPGAAPGKPGLLAPPELRATWLWRRRVARSLLVFGVVAGVMCTHAILGSIVEENAVVQLAQELVAHEVVVAEAAHAQIKAKEAAATISIVQVRRRGAPRGLIDVPCRLTPRSSPKHAGSGLCLSPRCCLQLVLVPETVRRARDTRDGGAISGQAALLTCAPHPCRHDQRLIFPPHTHGRDCHLRMRRNSWGL